MTKKTDFITKCIRCAGRDDFLQLDELLKTKMAQEIKTDETLGNCAPIFETLGAYADEKVEQYRIGLVAVIGFEA